MTEIVKATEGEVMESCLCCRGYVEHYECNHGDCYECQSFIQCAHPGCEAEVTSTDYCPDHSGKMRVK